MQALHESCLVADTVSQKTATLPRFKLNAQGRADLEVQPCIVTLDTLIRDHLQRSLFILEVGRADELRGAGYRDAFLSS